MAVDCRGDCGDWFPGPGFNQNTMKAPQPELKGIPQFDSGRWKLRLERVPVDPDNETMTGMEFDSVTQARVDKTNKAHWLLCYQSTPV